MGDASSANDAAEKRYQGQLREVEEKLAKQLSETQRLETKLAEQAADFQRQWPHGGTKER